MWCTEAFLIHDTYKVSTVLWFNKSPPPKSSNVTLVVNSNKSRFFFIIWRVNIITQKSVRISVLCKTSLVEKLFWRKQKAKVYVTSCKVVSFNIVPINTIPL